MRKTCYQAVVAVWLSLWSTGATHAQETNAVAAVGMSGGGIIDWIQKLSGPSILRGGLFLGFDWGKLPQIALPPGTIHWRVTGLHSIEVWNRGTVTPASSELSLQSLQLTAAVPVARALEQVVDVGIGVSLHRFTATLPDDTETSDSFIHWSLPVFAQLRATVGHFLVIGGVAAHVFPPFPDDAFGPVAVTVERSSLEVPLGLFFIIEWF